MELLSTREWATVIWGFVFWVYAMAHKQIREALWNVVKIFFGKKLRILWSIILLYVLGITLIFCQLPFWDNIYIKDIIVWFIFSGLIYCMNAVSKDADEKYIENILKNNLKFTVIFEFIMNTFTFNIWIELIIVPIITVIVMMNIVAEHKMEYKAVHKLLDIVLAIMGFGILYETIKIAVHEYKYLNAVNTFISFMIPIVYLIMIVPLEYILELYSKYENLFVRMKLREDENKEIQSKHRRLILIACKLSVHKVMLFQEKYWNKVYKKMSMKEFEKIIEEFKNEVIAKDNLEIFVNNPASVFMLSGLWKPQISFLRKSLFW